MPLSSTSKGWPLCHCQAHTTVSPPIHPTLFHRCQALLGCLGSPYLRRSNMKLYIPHNPRQHTHLCKVPSHLFRRQIRPSTPRILVMANVPMSYQWFDNEVIPSDAPAFGTYTYYLLTDLLRDFAYLSMTGKAGIREFTTSYPTSMSHMPSFPDNVKIVLML